ncbi:CatB-related O-acetyltransferase [Natronolimnobius sp. AArcel1]|nr:CatB-related O-acetyltransferase [Natronolimnobius sp. AArcel1]NGM67719.1 CatB-related O-acetyltransferase [Natronolimnobius sp. AArcel1]
MNRVLSVLGYPSAIHGVLNRHTDSLELAVASSARLSRGCLLRGTIELGPRTRLSRGCVLSGDVRVGRGTNLEPNCDLIGDVSLGNYCAIARDCIFQEPNHKLDQPSLQIRLYDEVLDSGLDVTSNGPISVGNDVWIGARAVVLSGVTIGDGAVIGAGSIVTDDVEPYAVVAGVPAERIKWRFPESVRERLLDLEWWEWDEDRIRANQPFFEQELEDADDVPPPAGLEALPESDSDSDRVPFSSV